MSVLDVVCAIIVNDHGQILACQRSQQSSSPGKWEFPGGKIELGETTQTALKREILEELGAQIIIQRALNVVNHSYSDFKIALYPFICQIKGSKAPTPIEHSQIRWINHTDTHLLDWSEADITVLENYQQQL